VVGAHTHPSGVGDQVIEPVGDRLAGLTDEVADLDLLRVTGGPVVLAVVLLPADELLFLAVHADHRHPGGQGRRDGAADVAALRVAVGVLGALQGLGVGLQAATGLVQQPPHECRRDTISLGAQLLGQAPQTTSTSSAAGSSGPHASRGRPACPTPRASPGRGPRRVCARRPDHASGPPGAVCGSSSSVRPRRTVSGETPTASATIPTPPNPSSRASPPSQTRR
jgi:hypothetical protein